MNRSRSGVNARPANVSWGLLLACVAVTCTTACPGRSPLRDSETRLGDYVSVSNYPLAYFARRVGEGQLTVKFDVPADMDPSFWQPGDVEINSMQRARRILLNGASYEKWLSTVTLPENQVVDTAAVFQDRWITIENPVTHRHGPGQQHAHEGIATHTWLDPQLAIEQLEQVTAALRQSYPEAAETLTTRSDQLRAELSQLDQRITRELGGYTGQTILTSHPVYQYLGRRLGVRLESVVWEPDTTPNAEARQELEEILRAHPATLMLWEAEPTAETRQYLDQLGVRVVVVETCGNRPATGDLLSAMNANLDRLSAALLASESP